MTKLADCGGRHVVHRYAQNALSDVFRFSLAKTFFLTMGFYGGWMPLICLVLCLFYYRRGAVMLLPMLLCFGILVIGPASCVRYAVPLLYAAPLMMGVLCRPNVKQFFPRVVSTFTFTSVR
ncbi:MAG: hypothetical protein IJG88_02075 [Eggerthellaceae bacterium]|nr:hypothetical protein [Eggerthellaceae bacterium]